jgi:hypothetical protein
MTLRKGVILLTAWLGVVALIVFVSWRANVASYRQVEHGTAERPQPQVQGTIDPPPVVAPRAVVKSNPGPEHPGPIVACVQSKDMNDTFDNCVFDWYEADPPVALLEEAGGSDVRTYRGRRGTPRRQG